MLSPLSPPPPPHNCIHITHVLNAIRKGRRTPPKISLLGQVGHLTHEQEVTLEEFRSQLVRLGLYDPGDPSKGRKASHTDATLLRFLRARGWVPAKAIQQFADREAWGKKMDIDNLYADFDVDEFVTAQQFYPMWTGRRDKMGYPIYVFRLASLGRDRMTAIHSVPNERRYERITVLHTLLMRTVAPLCSHLPSPIYPTPIESITTIVDLEGVSFSLMWSLRNHLQQASVLANANFPETMGSTWLVNAPSYFSVVWGWLKSWFDENTRRKIHVLSKASMGALLEAIDAENLPKDYGGMLEWTFDDPPSLDGPAKEALKDVGGEFPKGPWELIDGKVVLGKDILKVKANPPPAPEEEPEADEATPTEASTAIETQA